MSPLDELRVVFHQVVGNGGALRNCRKGLDEVAQAERLVRSLRCRVIDDEGNGAPSLTPSPPIR